MNSRSTRKYAFHSLQPATAPQGAVAGADLFSPELEVKVAKMASLAKTALQLGSELVSSPPQSSQEYRVGFSPEKCAHTASALNQLSTLVGEVQSSHHNGVKVASALAGAVKLAQDGVIALEDVFEHAKQMLINGTTKVAALDAFDQPSVGEVVDAGAKSASTSSGQNGNGEQLDVLTAWLRSRRR